MTALLGGCAVAVVFLVVSALHDCVRRRRRLRELASADRESRQSQIEDFRFQGVTVRDWPEDFAHENGNYSCICADCGESFTGHKRRLICKVCSQEEWERKRGVGTL